MLLHHKIRVAVIVDAARIFIGTANRIYAETSVMRFNKAAAVRVKPCCFKEHFAAILINEAAVTRYFFISPHCISNVGVYMIFRG